MFSKSLKNLSVVLLYILLTFSCSSPTPSSEESKNTNDSGNSETTNTVSPSPLIDEYSKIKAELDSSWNTLASVEKEKIFTLNRLLEEISYNPSHRKSRLNELKKEIKQLENAQLTPESLSDLKNMDDYDALCDQVIANVLTYKETTPNMNSYKLADALVTDLDSLNFNAVISKRGDYGNVVLKYNEFILKNESGLKASGLNLKPVPGLFEPEI